ncbi:17-beta-hydroxysteroid dehydrogenase 14 [Mytilus edulis]|uniref:17-beta-hydroxysteroid dehydrogenase 14 n=1 Tax=Mytilus edulis TaxID=6550 RepID=A0A8S3PU04_MYTED|nr:17-beta-hydroxysteroid dehydrogenase 14 [Mytilus edulis]
MSGLRYKEKITLVSGGSRGIGKGCVEVFVENGAHVVFCSNDEEEGKHTERDLNSRGPGESCFIYGDVTKEPDIKNIVEKTIEKYGRLDCLINNVGTRKSSPHPIDEFSAEDFRKLIDLNVVSYFLFSKYALPYLRLTEGSIINISSLVGNIGQGQAVTYCATKGAITSMTKALAIDESKYNVRVNSISPSNIWTPLFDSYLKTCPESEEVKKGFENNQLLGRFGTIQEIGQACLFLAADATFCTGIEINMSAGAELNYANKNMRPKAS